MDLAPNSASEDGSRSERLGVAGGDGLAGHAYNGGGGGVFFGASAIAAGAGFPLGLDGDVAEFSGHAVHAVPDFSVENDAPADAGTERNERRRCGMPRAAPSHCSPRAATLASLSRNDAGAQSALDFVAHGIVFPSGKVGRLAHGSGSPCR